jgi:hypothetical protein
MLTIERRSQYSVREVEAAFYLKSVRPYTIERLGANTI